MKITILNGSPKGNESVTMQYVKFMQKHFPDHEYVFHNISKEIKRIEKKSEIFDKIISDIESSDGVIWSAPVYTLFVPAQYMRFIELIYERDAIKAFKGKYTTVITTSIHFYDHTAHRYMNAICDDLGMNYTGYFSAEMNDLLRRTGRNKLLLFTNSFFDSIKNRTQPQKRFQPVIKKKFIFKFVKAVKKNDLKGKKVVIVTDNKDQESNIAKMIKRFSDSFTESIELVNLWDINIKGACMGCLGCGYENICVYKDDFTSFYRSKILPADIVIMATQVTHRNFSAKLKEFYDRRFFLNHRPEYKDKQFGFLVSGSIDQMPYMYDFFQGAVEWHGANIVGIVRDESCDQDEINSGIQHLAQKCISFSEVGYCQPPTFLGVGGSKVFRDDVWGQLRSVCQADFRYYKDNGLFNFPHKKYKNRLFNSSIMLLTKIPRIRKAFYKKLNKMMYQPHKKNAE
ncbi:MAG: flavodoxin [Desulfobacteraceae bacterium]|nr:flavodoxin [Desulfobacteraceae bacterium]